MVEVYSKINNDTVKLYCSYSNHGLLINKIDWIGFNPDEWHIIAHDETLFIDFNTITIDGDITEFEGDEYGNLFVPKNRIK